MSARSDRQAERIRPTTVLWVVLGAYPAPSTGKDVIDGLASDPPTPIEKSFIEKGIGDLLKAGVLRREGEVLIPTTPTLFLERNLKI
jgi:hypothetical protein